MRLVVDSCVLVAELFREGGRRRWADPRLELFLAQYTWAEVEHELPKRASAFARHQGISDDRMRGLVKLGLDAGLANLAIVPEAAYAPLEDEARWRSAGDPADWPAVALALTLDVAIWTDDRDFFGIGVSIWSTATVRAWLERHPQAD